MALKPHEGMVTPKFHHARGRVSLLPARADVRLATPASHSRYTWISPVHDRQRYSHPRFLPCGATRLDSRFFPTGASIVAAGSSAPLERGRARRSLGLGVSPLATLLAKRRAARRLGYPPSGVRPIRSASEGCKPLVHRGLMDSIQFSKNVIRDYLQ